MRKIAERIFAFAVAAVMLLGMCACAKDNVQDSGSAGSLADAANDNITDTEAETYTFTDSCGREVELPRDIQRVAPSGQIATMILAAAAPDKLACVAKPLGDSQRGYLDDALFDLPVTGELYGSKSNLNLEEFLALDVQLILDFGDYKNGMEEDLDALQQQTGIPVVFIAAGLDSMESAFRTLGPILDKGEHCNAIADLVGETLTMAAENRAKIGDGERVSVMFTTGEDGLGTNAKGSFHAQVLEKVGVDNAIVVEELSHAGGGNKINMEQLYIFDPDIIVMNPGAPYDSMATDPAWAQVRAVQEGNYYLIPAKPYNWLSDPPSMNMILGIWWLGNLAYPEIYDYDMVETAQRCYKVLWGYDLSEAEAKTLLGIE